MFEGRLRRRLVFFKFAQFFLWYFQRRFVFADKRAGFFKFGIGCRLFFAFPARGFLPFGRTCGIDVFGFFFTLGDKILGKACKVFAALGDASLKFFFVVLRFSEAALRLFA